MPAPFDLLDRITAFLSDFDERGLYPEFPTLTAGVNEPLCWVDGSEYLLFGCNNYLGLSHHPAVKAAGQAAVARYGVGPGASRLVAGNLDVIEALEAEIAALTGTEACLTFPTGYMANVSVFQALMEPFYDGAPLNGARSALFLDQYNHGSVWDGCGLTSAEKVLYRHNDLEHLEAKLRRSQAENKVIVTEGVFSLYGEIVPLPEYIELARRYSAKLFVDDAHGVGLLGEYGGGTGEHWGCAGEIDILMGCMDKAFGGTGGFICGSRDLIRYLRIATRSFVLSSALPAGMAGAMRQAVAEIREGQDLRRQLFANAAYLRTALVESGFTILGPDSLPAIALYLGRDDYGIAFARGLGERHIMCPLMRWPAVSRNASRLRVTVMVTHTRGQLDAFVSACCAVRSTLGPTPVPAAGRSKSAVTR